MISGISKRNDLLTLILKFNNLIISVQEQEDAHTTVGVAAPHERDRKARLRAFIAEHQKKPLRFDDYFQQFAMRLSDN